MEHIHCCLCLEDAHGIPVDASHPRSVKATVMLRVEFSFAGKKRIGHKASKHGHSPRGEACEDACLDPLTHPRPALSAPPRRPSPRLVSHPMSSPFLHPLHTIQNHPSPFNEPFPPCDSFPSTRTIHLSQHPILYGVAIVLLARVVQKRDGIEPLLVPRNDPRMERSMV